MFKALLITFFVFPSLLFSAVEREIGGIKYHIYDEFDSADGECVLRGYEYATSFYSTEEVSKLPILVLNSDGSVKSVLDVNNSDYPFIQEIDCSN
ncbi:MAG: hypothetical protein N4A33_00955 [Bacteriovoracaceae bacterium]|jgi:hypothetical protein|nr:hypothetical protein [Bacteriovoracaceae bacterium]